MSINSSISAAAKVLGLKTRVARLTVSGVLLANTVFWCWFWLDIIPRLEPYEHRPLRFEEVLPEHIFFGQALPFPQNRTAPSMKAMGAPPGVVFHSCSGRAELDSEPPSAESRPGSSYDQYAAKLL